MSSFTSRRNHRIITLCTCLTAIALVQGCATRPATVKQEPPPVCLAVPQSQSTAPTTKRCDEDWVKSMERRASEKMENELSKWESQPENEFAPEVAELNPQLDIAGEWLYGDALIDEVWIPGDVLCQATFRMSRATGNSYRVEFYTSGCLSRWRLQRTATFADGVLQLNRPVIMYCSPTFDKLYAVRSDNSDYLIPATNKRFVTRFGRRPMPAPGI